MDLERYREENFDVRVQKQRHSDGHELIATNNGYQWSGITFYTKEQILEAAKKLQEYAEKLGE